MSMSKRDYQALAEAIGKGYRYADAHYWIYDQRDAATTTGIIEDAVVDMLVASNPRFDPDRFRAAVQAERVR